LKVAHGENWTAINNGLTDAYVFTLAIAPNGDIFAGTDSSIFRTTDNGKNWEKVYNIYYGILSISVNSYGDIFVGTFDEGIYRSTDNGENWEKTGLETGLEYISVNTLAINSNSYIFAGTGRIVGTAGGVFRSSDNGRLGRKSTMV
jgi:photosystem II stability/assembly factor-like uncharacterized protein